MANRRSYAAHAHRGLTLIEVVITMAIMGILVSAVMPLAEVTVQRTRELELRRALRILRTAIDQYKEDFDQAARNNYIIPEADQTGYPTSLEELVEGKEWGELYSYPRKYLRRIPRDPFGDGQEWGLRGYRDAPDAATWDGKDIYDVYSKSDGIALDSTEYSSW